MHPNARIRNLVSLQEVQGPRSLSDGLYGVQYTRSNRGSPICQRRNSRWTPMSLRESEEKAKAEEANMLGLQKPAKPLFDCDPFCCLSAVHWACLSPPC